MSGSRFAVVGAGIVGVMTALELRKQGHSVTLYDGWEPGHTRAASSGTHRVTRSAHGADELYTRWQWEARMRWMELQAEWGVELFRETGGLLLAETGRSAWETAAIPTLARLGIPALRLSPAELSARWPHMDFQRVEFGLYEPHAGFLWSRRALVTGYKRFVEMGGEFVRARPRTTPGERLEVNGSPLNADVTVVSTGSWMREMFRRTLGHLLEVVRQDVIFISPPEGSRTYDADRHPVWIDHGYPGYGIPAVEGHGFKAVIAWHQSDIDLDSDDRVVDRGALVRSRQYLSYRFPQLVDQPITDQKVCHIVMTPDTHFLFDFHPEHPDIVLAGGGSGGIFKHAPVIGEYVAGMATGRWRPDARFTIQNRTSLALGESPSGR
ncbi:MAG: FAD-dependent oxidoreductase [Acidimicrobiia bacterium]